MRLLVLAALFLPLAATAQPRDGIDGGDGPLHRPVRTDGVLCTVYPEHLVLESGAPGRLDGLVVKELSKPQEALDLDTLCSAHDGLRVLYEAELSSNEAFLIGLRYPYLILDLGIEPEHPYLDRQFEAIDLRSGESQGDLYQPMYRFEIMPGYQLSYFAEMSSASSEGERCEKAEENDWFGYLFEERLVLDLQAQEVWHTGEVACSTRNPY